MAKFKSGYLDTVADVKRGLMGVVVKYLGERFPDLKANDLGQWPRYQYSFARIFSRSGGAGYARAVKLLNALNNAESSEAALNVVLSLSKDASCWHATNLLHRKILDHLLEKVELSRHEKQNRSELINVLPPSHFRTRLNTNLLESASGVKVYFICDFYSAQEAKHHRVRFQANNDRNLILEALAANQKQHRVVMTN